MKHISSALLLAGLASIAANAQSIITEPTRTFTVGTDIADTQTPPAAFLQTISDSAIASLTRVEIGLHLVGTAPGAGFASEMYVALNRNLGQSAVLLNRVGITTLDPVGQGYDGWNVTFRDDAVNGDIHAATLASGTLGGIWAPDGRVASTDTVRLQVLSLFNGGTGNGDWRLLVGDLDLGGTMRLQSWSITLAGLAAVPEPVTYPAVAGIGLLAFAALRKKIMKYEG